MRRQNIIFFVLLPLIFLAGCGKNTIEKEIEEYRLSDAAHQWEGGPLQEVIVPPLKDFLLENGVVPVWEEKLEISDDSIAEYCASKDGERYPMCIPVFSFEKGEWALIDADASGETSDGIKYSSMSSPAMGLSGKTGVKIHTDSGNRMAELSGAVPGESYELVTGSLEIPTGDKFGSFSKTIIDKGGDVYEWVSPGNTAETYCKIPDMQDKTLLKCRTKDKGTVEIDGWLCGAVQKNRDSDVLFYGIDRGNNPSMWDATGNKKDTAFPEEVSLYEYYVTCSAEGSFIYFDINGLWEVSELGTKKLLSFEESGYKLQSALGISCGDGRIVRLLGEMDGEPLVLTYDLSKKDVPMDKKEIVLAMGLSNAAFSRMVADFNRYDDEYRVTVRVPERGEDIDSFRRRIQLEISAGKGPDLLEEAVVNDIETMIDKSFFKKLDIKTFKSSGCLETALLTGVYGKDLYGIPYEFSLDFAAIRKDEASDNVNLSVEKMMELVRASGKKYLDSECSPANIVLKYGLYDESNTDYIDWAKHKSKLTEKPFLDLLSFAAKYGAGDSDYESMKKQSFAKSPTYFTFTLSDFKEYSEDLGEYVITGYPRKEGHGIYMTANRIYLSSHSKEEEGAVRFLRYLVSERAQGLYAAYDDMNDIVISADKDGYSLIGRSLFPIHRTILEQLIKKEDGNNPDNQIKTYGGQILYLKVRLSEKQKEEFWFMVDNALPGNFRIKQLEEIFREELEPYFEGQCSVETAAAKLDNRVQTYLNEKN